ncbi:MAG: nickel pincer cofactor biosynthesis protein LarC [Phycisphaerae bacterium]
MTLAYFDCFAGAAGDMIVASLLDAGADFDRLRSELDKLQIGGYDLRVERMRRSGFAASQFCVDVADEHHHQRHLSDILGIIGSSPLPDRVKDRSRRIFTRLAEAEASVHGIDVSEVHFHEVGAVDSIVDVVGACVAMELLGIERVISSPLTLGSGTVECAHGTLPVPAPATAELVRAAAVRGSDIDGEATTPTAAAILTTLSEHYGPLPEMRVESVGIGGGTRERENPPNVLRVFVGEEVSPGSVDSAVELSCNVDDCTGEIIGATVEKLLSSGCLDAWATPIVMKKSRPAWMLSALAMPADAAEVERIMFRETTTFGVRRRVLARSKLRRRHETVETPYGPVRVKLAELGDEVLTASGEFSDCHRAAEAHGVAVKEVMAAALEAYRTGRGR